jgi:hypothetical protein
MYSICSPKATLKAVLLHTTNKNHKYCGPDRGMKETYMRVSYRWQLCGGLQVIVMFPVSEWIHSSRGSYRITVHNRILLHTYAK